MKLWLKKDRSETTEVSKDAYLVFGRNVYDRLYRQEIQTGALYKDVNIPYKNGWYIVLNMPFFKKTGSYMDPYTFQACTGPRYVRMMLIVRRSRNKDKWGIMTGVFWRPCGV